MIGERTQAVRIFGGVRRPVAEGGGIVVAAGEPAIVQHEAFDATRAARGAIGQRLQPGLVMIEIEAFPAVEVDEARRHAVRRPWRAGARTAA